MSRFANQRIADLVNFIGTPNSARSADSGQYFFGMNEREWRNDQDNMHRYLQKQGTGYNSKQQAKRQVMNKLGVSEPEAFKIVNHSIYGRNNEARHVNKGVPHAFQQEEIARRALVASGNPSMFNPTSSAVGTDLVTMLGNLRQFVDVQNRYLRPGRPDKMSIGILQGLDNNAGVAAFRDASGKTELQDIIADAKQRSGGKYGSDKLYEERGLSDVEPDMVKDYLVTSPYDVTAIDNLGMRAQQGSYDPKAPMGDIETIDLNHLRDELFGMQKRDLLNPNLVGGTLLDDSRKLKLSLPMRALRHFGSPSEQLVNSEVNEVLRSLGV